ncbi:hypothetical protein T06_15249 [Trichinella sp. T6]|nr:hypothetical protein T06_15249 [Trichinella sp. T6]
MFLQQLPFQDYLIVRCELPSGRSKMVCQNSVSANSVDYGCGLHDSLTAMPISFCLFRHKCVFQPSYMAYHRMKLHLLVTALEYVLLESITACLNDVVFLTISICNRYGTNVLKAFQICNMAMQTATLPLTVTVTGSGLAVSIRGQVVHREQKTLLCPGERIGISTRFMGPRNPKHYEMHTNTGDARTRTLNEICYKGPSEEMSQFEDMKSIAIMNKICTLYVPN